MTVPASSKVKSIDDLIKTAPLELRDDRRRYRQPARAGAAVRVREGQGHRRAVRRRRRADHRAARQAGRRRNQPDRRGRVADQGRQAARRSRCSPHERIESLPDVKTAKEQGFDIVVNQRRWICCAQGRPGGRPRLAAREHRDRRAGPRLQEVPEGQLHLGVGHRARPGQDRGRGRPHAVRRPRQAVRRRARRRLT